MEFITVLIEYLHLNKQSDILSNNYDSNNMMNRLYNDGKILSEITWFA